MLPAVAVRATGFAFLVLATMGMSACAVQSLDISSKRCPCSAGYRCDTSTQLCVRGGLQEGDGNSGSGTGGTTGGVDASEPSDASRPGSDGGLQGDATVASDGGTAGSCDPPQVGCLDPDGDGVSDDGERSGVKGDAPCRDGIRQDCDDNCPLGANSWQDDGDNDGEGDVCDAEFCRASSKLVAVGHGDQVHVSSDQGLTWSRHSPGAAAKVVPVPNWEDVVHGRGTWLTNNGHGQGSTWARSVGGTAWSVHSLSAWQGVTSAQGVGYGDGIWMLGSEDGRLAVSYDDGLSFVSLGAPKGWNGTAIESLAYHAGRWMAVGDSGQIAYSDAPHVLSSWRMATFELAEFKHIVVVAGRWVAAGKSACYYSDDRGVAWKSCGVETSTFYGLHYSNGLWMLGDLRGGAFVSRGDPTHWTEQVFLSAAGAWPVYGDCATGRWFAGHQLDGVADYGLRLSENEGRDENPRRVLSGELKPLYGITGN